MSTNEDGQRCQIKAGDRVTFLAAPRAGKRPWDAVVATRVVNGFQDGRPTVRYGGRPDFCVRLREIIDVSPHH